MENQTMTTFEKNLAALKTTAQTSLLAALERVNPNENLEVFVGKDSADINFFDKNNGAFLFPQNGVAFSVQKIEEFNEFALFPYLYFFGLGNGIFYKMLLTNANLKRVIVLEPNLEIVFSVLNLVNLAAEIAQNRLVILHSSEVSREILSPYFFKNKNALLYAKLFDLHIFNGYYDLFLGEARRINSLFIEIIEHGVVAVGNDSKDAIIGIRHHIANLPKMLSTPSLTQLIRAAKTTDTAIIVSTGPSLFKQLGHLRDIAPYATIFCIDASFPILAKHGIRPDIVLSLERVEATARFYHDTPREAFEGVVFEITSIAHEAVLAAIEEKGGALQMSQRPFGYTSYFELGDYGYLGIGMSAANMAFELVVHCGFEKCILIGQDLAFGEDGKSHSRGAVYGEDEIKKSAEAVYLPRYGGDGVVESTKVWKLFWGFFVKDIFETRERICVINATEGGARINGTIEMPFSAAIAAIPKEREKANIALDSPKDSAANLKKARAKIEEILRFGGEKKAKIEALFLKIAEKCEELEKANAENTLESFDFAALDSLFDEIEEVKALFLDEKFLKIFNDAAQAMIFHQEMELAKITTKRASDEVAKNAKKIEWLFAHKSWLFSLAGCIDSVLFCVEDSFQKWRDSTP